MKKITTIVLIGLAFFMLGCNSQVPQGTVGKILGKNGFQPEIYPPSKVWLANNIWNPNPEKLVLVETTTEKFNEPIKVLLKDKLTLKAEIVFRGRINSKNPKVLNSIFNDMKLKGNRITTADVYNIYGKMIILNTARDVISQYNVDEINRNYERITAELYKKVLPKLKGLPIEISDVTIGNIEYPEVVTKAIEVAKKRQMEIQKAQADAQIKLVQLKAKEAQAKAEYKIKMMEAKRIRDFNKMTADGITPSLLKLRALEIKQQEIDKWDGVMPKTVVGGEVPVLISNKN